MQTLRRIIRRGTKSVRRAAGREFRVQVRRPVQRHGSDYGGWCMCPIGISKESVVYSFGVGEDISFDLSLIETFGLNVFAFDPTPRCIRWIGSQALPPTFRFFPEGLAAFDGTAKFKPPTESEHVSYTLLDRPETASRAISVPVLRLGTFAERLGHSRIDILKMDIEGAEYQVIQDLVRSDIEIHQLLVEFHHRFKNVAWADTKQAVDSLNHLGYMIFHVSQDGNEISFIRPGSG